LGRRAIGLITSIYPDDTSRERERREKKEGGKREISALPYL